MQLRGDTECVGHVREYVECKHHDTARPKTIRGLLVQQIPVDILNSTFLQSVQPTPYIRISVSNVNFIGIADALTRVMRTQMQAPIYILHKTVCRMCIFTLVIHQRCTGTGLHIHTYTRASASHFPGRSSVIRRGRQLYMAVEIIRRKNKTDDFGPNSCSWRFI